ncbi:MAG TPA: hypothetical protein VEV83_15430 [Parafilimonas sp.]|nr:hypothetical protein [Parafilimonas sp.]
MFESILMQIVPPSPPPSTDVISNIVAVIVAVGAIATALGTFMSHNDKFKKYGQYLTAFGQKTVEQEGNIAALGNAITGLSPEAKAYLEAQNASIAELRRRAEVAEKQLEKLQGNIPEAAQADNKADLPR